MCNLIRYEYRRSSQYHTACVCVIVGHTDRPAQQSNHFLTDVQIIAKKMIMVLIMPSRSEDGGGGDKDIIYGNEKGLH